MPAIRQNLKRLLTDDKETGVRAEREWDYLFWLRQWLGSCWIEEFDEVGWEKYEERINHLVELWETRQGGFVSEDE